MKNLDSLIAKFAQLSKETVGQKDIENEMRAALDRLRPAIKADIERGVKASDIIINIKAAFEAGGYDVPPKAMLDDAVKVVAKPTAPAKKAKATRTTTAAALHKI